MAQEFTKRVKLSFDADKRSVDQVMSELAKIGESVSISNEVQDQVKAYKAISNEISHIRKQYEEISVIDSDAAKETAKALQERLQEAQSLLESLSIQDEPKIEESRNEFVDALKNEFDAFSENQVGLAEFSAKKMKAVFDFAWEGLKSILSESWKELQNMLQYSLLSNAQTRDTMFTYGFSASQAYGFDKAKSLLGIQSEEDLMYMNPQQQRKFQDYMMKYADKYSALYDSGTFDEMLEYNYEMEDFKQEMQVEVVQFFMKNKDLIKDSMTAMMTFSEFAIQSLGWLVDYFGGKTSSTSERAAMVSDIISNYSTSNKTTNVKVDNTFNNVSRNDQTWLANAGQMTYKQMIDALR